MDHDVVWEVAVEPAREFAEAALDYAQKRVLHHDSNDRHKPSNACRLNHLRLALLVDLEFSLDYVDDLLREPVSELFDRSVHHLVL